MAVWRALLRGASHCPLDTFLLYLTDLLLKEGKDEVPTLSIPQLQAMFRFPLYRARGCSMFGPEAGTHELARMRLGTSLLGRRIPSCQPGPVLRLSEGPSAACTPLSPQTQMFLPCYGLPQGFLAEISASINIGLKAPSPFVYKSEKASKKASKQTNQPKSRD